MMRNRKRRWCVVGGLLPTRSHHVYLAHYHKSFRLALPLRFLYRRAQLDAIPQHFIRRRASRGAVRNLSREGIGFPRLPLVQRILAWGALQPVVSAVKVNTL